MLDAGVTQTGEIALNESAGDHWLLPSASSLGSIGLLNFPPEILLHICASISILCCAGEYA